MGTHARVVDAVPLETQNCPIAPQHTSSLTRSAFVLTLNFVLSQVWSLVGEEARVSAAKETSTAVVIDITKHGYFKLLGKGQLPAQPVVVRAKFVSKLAEKKIKEVRWETALVEEAIQGRPSCLLF